MMRDAVPAPVVTLDPETGFVQCGSASVILTHRQRMSWSPWRVAMAVLSHAMQ